VKIMSTGTSELVQLADRTDALRRSFNEGMTSSLILNGMNMQAVAETSYALWLEKRFGNKSPMYNACLKAWRTGYITARMVA